MMITVTDILEALMHAHPTGRITVAGLCGIDGVHRETSVSGVVLTLHYNAVPMHAADLYDELRGCFVYPHDPVVVAGVTMRPIVGITVTHEGYMDLAVQPLTDRLDPTHRFRRWVLQEGETV